MNLQEKAAFIRSNQYMAKTNILAKIGNTKENIQLYKKIHSRILLEIRQKRGISNVKNQIKKSIESKLSNLAKGLPSTNYSMGGVYYLKLGNSHYCGRYSDCRDYAKSAKYKAKHGSVSFSLDYPDYKNAKNIGNVLTVILGNTKYKAIKKAKWLILQGSKNTAKYIWNYGFIVGDYHGATIDQCKAVIERQKQLEKNKQLELKQYKKCFAKLYGYNDSIMATNCAIGTINFINKFGLNKSKKYKGGFLLKLAESVNMQHYIIRMFKATI